MEDGPANALADRPAAASANRPLRRWFGAETFIHAVFLVITALMLVPLVLVVMVSLTEEQAIMDNGYRFIPERLSFSAYTYFFEAPGIILRAYGVTIQVTVIGTLLGLLMTSMIGYVISRRDYGLNRFTTFFIFFTMLFNGGLVPFYILMTQFLHVKNTLLALILPALISPFHVMVMKGFLAKVPFEIIESAKMDGAREWRIYFRIVLPLSTPPLATIGLFIAFGYWNEWFNGLLFIDNEKLVPLQLLLVRALSTIDFITSRPEFRQAAINLNLGTMPKMSARFAMAVLAAGPMLFVFPFFQRYFIKGLTIGALKG